MLIDCHQTCVLGIGREQIIQIHVVDRSHRTLGDHHHDVQIFVARTRHFDQHPRAAHAAPTVDHRNRIDVALRVEEDALRLRSGHSRLSARWPVAADHRLHSEACHTTGHKARRPANETSGGKGRPQHIGSRCRDTGLDHHAQYCIGHHCAHGLRHHRTDDGADHNAGHYWTTLAKRRSLSR